VTSGREPVGIALKIADGDSDRARTAVVLALLRRLGLLPESALEDLDQHFPREIYNRRKRVVGQIKVNLPDNWGIGRK